MAFKPATRKKLKARIVLIGPPKSGKTLTALKFAACFARGGRVAVIDSEHGSASLYSDQVPFDSDEIMDYAVENYIAKLDDAAREGYPVVVIDSLSHAWAGLLEFVDAKTAQSKSKNSYTTGWRDGTPLQNRLVEAILSYPGHVIATLRTKVAYEIVEVNGGKAPVRIGTKPIQRDDIEYEFTVIGEMHRGTLTVTGSRCAVIDGGVYHHPGEDVASIILDWLEKGLDDPSLRPVGEDEIATAINVWPSMDLAEFQASARALHARIVRHRQPADVYARVVQAAKEEKTRRDKGEPAPSAVVTMEPNGEEAAAELDRADMAAATHEDIAPHEADEDGERSALVEKQTKNKKESKR